MSARTSSQSVFPNNPAVFAANRAIVLEQMFYSVCDFSVCHLSGNQEIKKGLTDSDKFYGRQFRAPEVVRVAFSISLQSISLC